MEHSNPFAPSGRGRTLTEVHSIKPPPRRKTSLHSAFHLNPSANPTKLMSKSKLSRGVKKLTLLHKQKQQVDNFQNEKNDISSPTHEEELNLLRAQLEKEYIAENPPPVMGMRSGGPVGDSSYNDNKRHELHFGRRFVNGEHQPRTDHEKKDKRHLNRLRSIETPAVLRFMANPEESLFAGSPSRSPLTKNGNHRNEKHMLIDGLNERAVNLKIIEDWMKSFDTEQKNFGSVALFAEMRLQEALNATNPLKIVNKYGKPGKNNFKINAMPQDDDTNRQSFEKQSEIRAAICCDLLKKTSRMFGRYESLMETLTDELLKSVYMDYDSVVKNSKSDLNARVFYECTPYFTIAKSLRAENEDLSDELEMYNDGVNVRQALVKCSVGVRTLFNDSKRQIRDMIFRIWRQYCVSRNRKMKRLRNRVCLEPWFNIWVKRHMRYKNQGYFYDTDSDDDDDQMEEHNEAFDEMANSFRKDQEIESELDAIEVSDRISPMSISSGASSPSTSPVPFSPSGRMRSLSRGVLVANRVQNRTNRRSLKLIREEEDTDGDGTRIVQIYERREHQVTMCNTGTQTDAVSFATDSATGVTNIQEEPKATEEPAKAQRSKSQMNVAKLLGGKKEKPMNLDAALTLIPSMFEQYLIMLLNPGPDTEGKHLNLVNFTKLTLTRKFGIKSIALKQCKAFLTCLTTSKAQEHPRIRVFSDLYGLCVGNNSPKDYDEEKVDFFFKKVLTNLLPDVKHVMPTFSVGEIDVDKVLVRIRTIFLNIRTKDSFKFLKIEREIETMESTEKKGLDFVKIDDVLEIIWYYWRTENLYSGYTKEQVLSCNRIQKMAKSYLVILKGKILQKIWIKRKFDPVIKKHDEVLSEVEWGKVCDEIGFANGGVEEDIAKCKKVYDEMYLPNVKEYQGGGTKADVKKKSKKAKGKEDNHAEEFRAFKNMYDVFFHTIWKTGYRITGNGGDSVENEQ